MLLTFLASSIVGLVALVIGSLVLETIIFGSDLQPVSRSVVPDDKFIFIPHPDV